MDFSRHPISINSDKVKDINQDLSANNAIKILVKSGELNIEKKSLLIKEALEDSCWLISKLVKNEQLSLRYFESCCVATVPPRKTWILDKSARTE